MPESLKTRLARWKFNLFPAYRGTGGRISYIASDWREVRVRLPLNWRTRNLVGTLFGGSIYGCIDPVYMIMLMRNLGRDYIVWDKAANIRFKKPGQGTVYAKFVLSEEELRSIRSDLESQPSVDRVYEVTLSDVQGTACAIVQKTLYVAKRRAR